MKSLIKVVIGALINFLLVMLFGALIIIFILLLSNTTKDIVELEKAVSIDSIKRYSRLTPVVDLSNCTLSDEIDLNKMFGDRIELSDLNYNEIGNLNPMF